MESSLTQLLRSVESERIYDLLCRGDRFEKEGFRFVVVDSRNVRIRYGNSKTWEREFYSLFTTPESEGSERLLFHFWTINGKVEEMGDEWYSELVVIDSELQKQPYAESIVAESARLNGDAPKWDALRLAGFILAAIVEEYVDCASDLERILTHIREDANAALVRSGLQ